MCPPEPKQETPAASQGGGAGGGAGGGDGSADVPQIYNSPAGGIAVGTATSSSISNVSDPVLPAIRQAGVFRLADYWPRIGGIGRLKHGDYYNPGPRPDVPGPDGGGKGGTPPPGY